MDPKSIPRLIFPTFDSNHLGKKTKKLITTYAGYLDLLPPGTTVIQHIAFLIKILTMAIAPYLHMHPMDSPRPTKICIQIVACLKLLALPESKEIVEKGLTDNLIIAIIAEVNMSNCNGLVKKKFESAVVKLDRIYKPACMRPK